jgi:hypothetical protein
MQVELNSDQKEALKKGKRCMKLQRIKRSSGNIDTIHACAGHYANIDRCHDYSKACNVLKKC